MRLNSGDDVVVGVDGIPNGSLLFGLLLIDFLLTNHSSLLGSDFPLNSFLLLLKLVQPSSCFPLQASEELTQLHVIFSSDLKAKA